MSSRSARFPLVPVVAIALVLAVAVGVGALVVAGGPSALRVGGEQIASRHEIDDQLAEFSVNEKFAEAMRGTAPSVVQDHELDAAATAVWLTIRARAAMSDQELASRKITPNANARSSSRAQLEGIPGFPKLSSKLQEELIDYFSSILALQGVIADEGSADLVTAARDACTSERYVAHILVPTLDAANALAAQLASGADFASLAKASSTDTGSKASGGELGCDDGQQFVAEFQNAVDDLAVGKVSAPVQTEFGYHLITVRDQPMQPDLQRAAGDIVTRMLRHAAVDVDSHYGRWQPSEARVCPLSGC